MAGVLDMIQSPAVTAPELAVYKLSGKNMPGGKGILDLLMAKRELGALLYKHAAEHSFEKLVVDALARWDEGAQFYRKDMGFGFVVVNKVVDISWVGTLKLSGEQFLRLYEDTCDT